MKKMFFLTAVMFFQTFIALGQNVNQSNDELIRKKICVDYIDQVHFEYTSPDAEALANLIIRVFKENLVILDFEIENLNETDVLKISSLKLALQNLLNSKVLTWEEIHNLEKNNLILLDKQLRRKSKYDLNDKQ